MNVEYIVNELKVNGTVAVAKKIDMNDKKLRKVLKAAGYEYSRKSGRGWYFVGTGEPPLKTDIREFIVDNEKARKAARDIAFTKNEMKVLRKVINEWVSIKNAVNEIKKEKEKILVQKNTNPIHSLYMRIGESGSKEKVSRTVNLTKETCSNLGTFEDVHRFNRDDIIEAALREFFEKI
ncbi:CopG family transcriptional regulator [Bacillus cereus group sp. MYBK30-1]|uniref:CopG family transcriptional regulator n=1 Tax=unclassified Bacillus cereus group TaxID=2750818 RepID=UPI003F79A711